MKKLDIPKLPSIKETVQALKNRQLTVLDLVTEHIKRAKEIQQLTNAFITIFDGETNISQYDPISAAKSLDSRIAKGDLLDNLNLLGIPFTTKDLYLVKNTKTTFGSKFMEDFIAPYTGTVLQKCLENGAILIAKTNCDPWGFGGSGENSGFGPAKNPFDLTRTPGGSSSGSSASMAAGVGFFSLGTDTGGSVRQPASMTGLYGFKPTYGRNSRFGIGVMGSSFDTPGFFARHAKDVELLENIMEGIDAHDPTSSDHNKAPTHSKIKTIGIPSQFYGKGLNQEIESKINSVIENLKVNGFEVKNVSLPSVKYSLAAYYVLVPAEISANRARYDGVRYGKKNSDNYLKNLFSSRTKYFEDEVKRRIMIGTYVLSAGYSDQFYKKASKVRTKIKQEFKQIFRQVDALITPTSPTTAFKLGEKTDNPLEMYLSDIYTVTANLVGIPSINIPIGMDSANLPVGMQVMGKWFDDFGVIKFAEKLSKCL